MANASTPCWREAGRWRAAYRQPRAHSTQETMTHWAPRVESPLLSAWSLLHESNPGRASFLAVLPFGRRGRIELDQRFRFLVGQPKDEVIVVDLAGRRVLLVVGPRPHLRCRHDRELASLDGLALPEQAHCPIESGNARGPGVFRVGPFAGKQGLVSRSVVAAAVFRHAEGQQ